MRPPKRHRREEVAPAPKVTIADFFRWHLTRPGAATSGKGHLTVEEFHEFRESFNDVIEPE